ncbi:hypothetical protein GCM10010358_74690 [Streptomyces minutiscleroticus]|uniref:Uncharacterized protein n=1 Tax=Streptomyces minutiscleroticus TaxID=68238 RepID=A0A918U8S6_9ACTN|nr:hypothetical protein GCM10010358_74690 [Streptomyces minutiscleroticus]
MRQDNRLGHNGVTGGRPTGTRTGRPPWVPSSSAAPMSPSASIREQCSRRPSLRTRATSLTTPPLRPVSSRGSRTAASRGVSPSSTPPPGIS